MLVRCNITKETAMFKDAVGYNPKMFTIDDIIAGDARPTITFETKKVTYRAHTLHEAGELWAKDGSKKLINVTRTG